VLQRGLRGRQCAAKVDIDHTIHLLQRRLLERFRNDRARIVHEHIKPAEGCHGFFDRSFDGFGISGVRLNRDRLSSGAFNRLDDRRRSIGAFCVVMATFAPSPARRLAIAAPIPREPPVTSAIFPSSFLGIVFP
jgi:hypothetical protein